MATGSGKTIIMGMAIAWQILNKVAYPQDDRFSKHIFVIAPGLTVKSRLQVLLPVNYQLNAGVENGIKRSTGLSCLPDPRPGLVDWGVDDKREAARSRAPGGVRQQRGSDVGARAGAIKPRRRSPQGWTRCWVTSSAEG
jgi:hypothetical protein